MLPPTTTRTPCPRRDWYSCATTPIDASPPPDVITDRARNDAASPLDRSGTPIRFEAYLYRKRPTVIDWTIDNDDDKDVIKEWCGL